MNSNGLLAKMAFNNQSLITPTFVYKTANNGFISVVDIYIGADPSLVTDVTVYITNQVAVPNNDDAIIVNKTLNGTLILNNIELSYGESIFVAATTTGTTGTISIQVRGLTQTTPPGLLVSATNI